MHQQKNIPNSVTFTFLLLYYYSMCPVYEKPDSNWFWLKIYLKYQGRLVNELPRAQHYCDNFVAQGPEFHTKHQCVSIVENLPEELQFHYLSVLSYPFVKNKTKQNWILEKSFLFLFFLLMRNYFIDPSEREDMEANSGQMRESNLKVQDCWGLKKKKKTKNSDF